MIITAFFKQKNPTEHKFLYVMRGKNEIETFIICAALSVIDDLNLILLLVLTRASLKQQIAFSVYRSLSMFARKFPVFVS